MENDTAPEYYLAGAPPENAAAVRTFDRDVAGLTAYNPYTASTQQIANYLADPTEEAILHMVNADPARTPTLAEFAKPDYYLQQGPATCDATTTGSTASAPTRATASPSTRASPGTTETTPRRSTPTTSASPAPASSNWDLTAPVRPTARPRPARTAARRRSPT